MYDVVLFISFPHSRLARQLFYSFPLSIRPSSVTVPVRGESDPLRLAFLHACCGSRGGGAPHLTAIDPVGRVKKMQSKNKSTPVQNKFELFKTN